MGRRIRDVVVGVAKMSRPKRKPKGTKPSGPRTIGVRVTGEWAEWLEELARFSRTDVAKLIDAACAEYAKNHGFTKTPPERIP